MLVNPQNLNDLTFCIAEVIDIQPVNTYSYDDGSDPDRPNNSMNLFTVWVRMDGYVHKPKVPVKPINVNIKKIPLIGELVLIFKSNSSVVHSTMTEGQYNQEQWYYISTIDVNSSINNNTVTGYTNNSEYDTEADPELKGKSFKEVLTSPLQVYEGDIIIEGRGGNTRARRVLLEDLEPHRGKEARGVERALGLGREANVVRADIRELSVGDQIFPTLDEREGERAGGEGGHGVGVVLVRADAHDAVLNGAVTEAARMELAAEGHAVVAAVLGLLDLLVRAGEPAGDELDEVGGYERRRCGDVKIVLVAVLLDLDGRKVASVHGRRRCPRVGGRGVDVLHRSVHVAELLPHAVDGVTPLVRRVDNDEALDLE